jgi:hypothetical protein
MRFYSWRKRRHGMGKDHTYWIVARRPRAETKIGQRNPKIKSDARGRELPRVRQCSKAQVRCDRNLKKTESRAIKSRGSRKSQGKRTGVQREEVCKCAGQLTFTRIWLEEELGKCKCVIRDPLPLLLRARMPETSGVLRAFQGFRQRRRGGFNQGEQG